MPAHAATAPLAQGFEDGAPTWTATGMWHVQDDPQAIQVSPAIAGELVTLPDDGFLPAPAQGRAVAWFGEEATGTYCGADYMTVRQHPRDGCTSTGPQRGTLTSPPFSLVGRSAAFLAYSAWWEIEAVNADVADLMQVEYSTDGGATWWLAQTLNPLEPAWGGNHQAFSDDGARVSAAWARHVVDLSGAAGAAHVQLRFSFDTVDEHRNGFRGLLIDDVALVDGIGAVILDDDTSVFTDDPPAVTVDSVDTELQPDGDWNVSFHVNLSHSTPHPVAVHWTVNGNSGAPVADGDVTIPPGTSFAPVGVTTPGADPPATLTLDAPTGATIALGTATVSTSSAAPSLLLGPITVEDAGVGLAAVTFTAQLSAPTTLPVSADWTVTGADGTTLATGRLDIAPGATSTTVSVLVPAVQVPVGVTLANAVNADIAPGAGDATSPPLVVEGAGGGGPQPTATSAAGGVPAEQPGQLVLGARETGRGAGPVLGKTFVLTFVSGAVRYHEPGRRYRALGSGSALLPVGSVVDATHGRARVTVASDAQGSLEFADFYSGAFGVFQRPAAHAVADIVLAAGNFGACSGSSRKRARHSGSKGVRRLWASGKGNFRTKGRFASATVRGTRWLTEDLCLATRVSVAEGTVAVYDFRRKRTRTVRAGDSVTIGALRSARYRRRSGRNAPRLSRVR